MIANQSKATSHNVTKFDSASGVFQVQTAFRGPYNNKDNNTQVMVDFSRINMFKLLRIPNKN